MEDSCWSDPETMPEGEMKTFQSSKPFEILTDINKALIWNFITTIEMQSFWECGFFTGPSSDVIDVNFFSNVFFDLPDPCNCVSLFNQMIL